jgi:hypothetical protein
MSGCVNFFNPPLIVFGGGVSRAGHLLLPGIRQAVLKLSTPLASRNLRIDITRLRDTAGTIGAAFAVIDQLLHADRFTWWTERNHAAATQRHGGQGPAITRVGLRSTLPTRGFLPRASKPLPTDGNSHSECSELADLNRARVMTVARRSSAWAAGPLSAWTLAMGLTSDGAQPYALISHSRCRSDRSWLAGSASWSVGWR